MSKKKKVIPYNPEENIGPKKQRGAIPPYFDIIMVVLPITAGIFAAWAMVNLHLEVTGGVIAKACLVGAVVAIVSYAINRFAVDWGTELSAGGYLLAGAFSLLSMMVVGACLWFFSFGGIVLPDVRILRFEDHGIALSQHLQLRQEQASKVLQVVPVVSATSDDLGYHSGCETQSGCVSGRGGGAGTLSRILDERSRRASSIAEQLDAGSQEFASIVSQANELLGEYQSVLNDDALSLKELRQELIRIDGTFVSLVGGLEQAVPVGLINAYAQELLDGVTIPGRPDATRAVNTLLRKHGQALQSVLGGIEREEIVRTEFPGKAGLSDTLFYVGNFAPLAGVIWVAEGIFPLALWIYTWLFLTRQRERAERGINPVTPSEPNPSAGKRSRRRSKGTGTNPVQHLNGSGSTPETPNSIERGGAEQ